MAVPVGKIGWSYWKFLTCLECDKRWEAKTSLYRHVYFVDTYLSNIMFPGVSPDWFEGFKLLLSCFRLDVCTSTLQQLPALSGPHGWPKNQGWSRGIMEAARQWNRFASTLILVLETGRVLTALQQVRVLAAARHGTAWYVSVFKSDCFRLLGDYRESLFCNPGFSEHCWIHKKMVLRWDAKTCLGAHEPKDPEAEGDQKRRGLSHNRPKSFFAAEISLVVSCVRSQIIESFCFLYFFVVGKEFWDQFDLMTNMTNIVPMLEGFKRRVEPQVPAAHHQELRAGRSLKHQPDPFWRVLSSAEIRLGAKWLKLILRY